MPTLTSTVLVLTLLFARSAPCLARTIRIPSEQPTIQAGLSLANPGDTVLVVAGVYSGDGNQDLTFGGKDVVLRSESGPEATVLDGSDLPPGGVHHGVNFYGTGETRACVIDGFTFRNFHGHSGSAMYIDGASPTITYCVFSRNSGGTEELKGVGGATIINFSSALITDCRFEDNSAYEQGGAVACGGDGASELTFERCTFLRNRSLSYYWGGAVACGWGGPFTFRDCLLAENSAPGFGGAVSLTSNSSDCSAILERCVFRENETTIYDGSGSGGAIGVRTFASASLVLRSCSFFHNQAQRYGGAIYCAGNVSLSLSNVTIAENGASYISSIALRSINSIGPDAGLDKTIVSYGQGQAIYCDPGSTLSSVSCCDIVENAGGDWVGCLEEFAGSEGNFSADPRFCGLELGDLTLEASSPCLPDQHPGGSDCGLIGAFDRGCTGPTAVQPSTWGAIKARFR